MRTEIGVEANDGFGPGFGSIRERIFDCALVPLGELREGEGVTDDVLEDRPPPVVGARNTKNHVLLKRFT